MKLYTLIEYCLLLILAGLYFAFLGFQSKGATFIIGVIFLYVMINIFSKRLLPRYIPENKQVSVLSCVLLIIGTVFLTMLILTLLAI
ncbi:hypothetical protein WQ54_01835 [Bacillus sp. SA1-12]|uniref:hypothetical protein n=1 Tax=Bacillus sp. SA1-12 TaxID=1455638 RepID=UPI000626595B|nr:hypothetical protein [Bacillus sp. SA1-12]KKI93817.1 hypothetical protein WQ54_01835 [Bacillus sp. SA1-12]